MGNAGSRTFALKVLLAAVVVISIITVAAAIRSKSLEPLNDISESIPEASSNTAAHEKSDYEKSRSKNIEANNSALIDAEQKVKRDRVKEVSDIKTDDPSTAIPQLEDILKNPSEMGSVKALAVSKLIEMDTTESLDAVIDYINSTDDNAPWVKKTAVAILFKANTQRANNVLSILSESDNPEIAEFLEKLNSEER